MEQTQLPEEVFAEIRARAAIAFDELSLRLQDVPELIEGNNPLAVLGALEGVEMFVNRIRVLMTLVCDLRKLNTHQSKLSFPKEEKK